MFGKFKNAIGSAVSEAVDDAKGVVNKTVDQAKDGADQMYTEKCLRHLKSKMEETGVCPCCSKIVTEE